MTIQMVNAIEMSTPISEVRILIYIDRSFNVIVQATALLEQDCSISCTIVSSSFKKYESTSLESNLTQNIIQMFVANL